MADISKCLISSGCEHKERCYRHTAQDSEYLQAYGMPSFGPEGCTSFWSNEGYRQASNDAEKAAK